MSQRDQVLGAVKRALRRENGAASPEVERRLEDHPRQLIPQRGQLPGEERVALFAEMARELAATVVSVPEAAAVPDAVADYLKAENLPAEIRMAPDPEVRGLPWDSQPLLAITEGPARESDPVSLTGGFAGVAETGTLMLHSGPEQPTTLNFLPETHIVVLPAARVVGAYEEAWDLLRDRFGAGTMPRTVNFITGPSRTADIEQTIQLGAHGPRRLHIILVGPPAEAAA